MNKQIEELWEKAAESTAAYPSGQNNSWETQVNFMENFARLIVGECLHIVDDEGCGEGGSVRAMEKIREHFGVDK